MKYDKNTLASIDINVVTEKHPSGDLDVIHFKLKTVAHKTKNIEFALTIAILI